MAEGGKTIHTRVDGTSIVVRSAPETPGDSRLLLLLFFSLAWVGGPISFSSTLRGPMNFTREVSSSGDQFKRLSRAALLAHDEQYKSLAPELT